MGCCGHLSNKQKVQNLVKDLKAMSAEYRRSGKLMADSKLQSKRLEICRKCSQYDKNSARCKKCGCFLAPKVTMIAATCPLHHW